MKEQSLYSRSSYSTSSCVTYKLQTATTELRRRLSPLFLASWLSVFLFGSCSNHDTLHENAAGSLVFGFRSLPIYWACLDGLSFTCVRSDMMKESVSFHLLLLYLAFFWLLFLLQSGGQYKNGYKGV